MAIQINDYKSFIIIFIPNMLTRVLIEFDIYKQAHFMDSNLFGKIGLQKISRAFIILLSQKNIPTII